MDFKIKVNNDELKIIKDTITTDLAILKEYLCTDYSFLLSVFSYDNYTKTKIHCPPNLILSTDKKFFYCISIIDYLVSFDYKKLFEMKYKKLAHYMKNEDDNISAEEPEKYANRLNSFVENNCFEISN